jgi:hypothetical protein
MMPILKPMKYAPSARKIKAHQSNAVGRLESDPAVREQALVVVLFVDVLSCLILPVCEERRVARLAPYLHPHSSLGSKFP